MGRMIALLMVSKTPRARGSLRGVRIYQKRLFSIGFKTIEEPEEALWV